MERIRQPTKKEIKVLRKLAALAYERELGESLAELGKGFDDWRAGEIDVWQLNDHIHRYHDGDSRDLWKKYNHLSPEELVGYAATIGSLGLISRTLSQ